MALICVDINALTKMVNSDGWWAGVRHDVIRSRSIVLVGARGKYMKEIRRNHKVRSWIIELGRAAKFRAYDKEVIDQIIVTIGAEVPESNCSECDDLHIFAIIRKSGCNYLFSEDKRLCVCKRKLASNGRGKKYTKFRVIRTGNIYKQHRGNII